LTPDGKNQRRKVLTGESALEFSLSFKSKKNVCDCGGIENYPVIGFQGEPMAPSSVAEQVRLLGVFLATGPLYTRYVVLEEVAEQVVSFPDTIQLFCSGRCQKEQTWGNVYRYTGHGGSNDRGIGQLVAYRCRNCQAKRQEYWYVWDDSGFWKVGQFPELQEVIEPKLNAALGPSRELYRKAIRSRSFGFGIGAVSYLRRIIEETTERLMDLLREEKWDEWSVAEKQQFEHARATYQYSQKIEFAAVKILPAKVFANGKDSFTALHNVTSNGLHGKSEEECLEIFDRCNLIFVHTFRVLHQHKLDREEFAAQLLALKR
jgi:hypothetical protein